MSRILCAMVPSLFALACTTEKLPPSPAEPAPAGQSVAPSKGADRKEGAKGAATPLASDPDLDRFRGLLDEARKTREAKDHAGARVKIASAIEQALAEIGDRDDAEALGLLEEMARLAQASGELRSAERARRQVVDARSRTLAEDDPDLQRAREVLAVTMNMLGDHAGARALFERVLEVRSHALPEDHPDLLSIRGNLALALRQLGDLAGARALLEQVLEIRSRTLPEDHHDLQVTRQNLASTLYALGNLEGARALDQRVLDVYTRTLPEDDADLQAARGNLALTIRELGDLAGARVLFEQVLEVLSRTLPGDNPSLQSVRVNLAGTKYALGDLAGARELFEQVLEVRSRTLPADHLDLQRTRGNLAAALHMLGDLAGARALFEQVVEVYSRTLPEDHPDLQWARTNLAVTSSALGDRAGAQALFEQVLEVRTRTLPDDNPDLQQARQGLAIMMATAGDHAGARPLFEKVLEVRSRTLRDDHPDLQLARQNVAITLKKLGDLASARALEEKVLEIRSRTLSDDHRDLQWARQNLAVTIASENARGRAKGEERRNGDGRDRCAVLFSALCRAQSRAVRTALLSSPSREAEERCARLSEKLDFALSFARGLGVFDPIRELETPAFLLSENARGAAIGAAGLARRAARAPGYADLRAALVEASGELARLAQGGTTSEAFDAAREKREKAERELIALARGVSGGELEGIELDVVALARRLGEDAASVSFRKFEDWRIEIGPGTDASGERELREAKEERLCAFVVRGRAPSDTLQETEDPLTIVDLGPVDPIAAAVREWRRAIGVAHGRGLSVSPAAEAGDLGTRGNRLRQIVFDPLLRSIGGRERIALVLDDVLHLVAFDALPLDADGTSLIGDRWKIETRATLGELWNEDASWNDENTLVAFGGVDYGNRDAAASGAEIQIAGILRGGAWNEGFPELPATAEEAQGIVAAFTRAFGAEASTTLLGRSEAKRESLLELAPHARFLHVATHGWFAPESIPSWSDSMPSQEMSGLGVRPGSEERVKGMSPMLLCGLALADANLPDDELGRAPGLVTAEEISALDLSHCELAVLSACDTNVGERRAGQGVASLQRALQMAGARSVITSLWKVPDEATKELMLDFYRRLWVEKKPKWQALWEAKKRLREAKDEAVGLKFTTRDWAAWVLTGDPN